MRSNAVTADSLRAWEVVFENLESDLIAGCLKPGDLLHGERALATGLGVSRLSVLEAMRVLAAGDPADAVAWVHAHVTRSYAESRLSPATLTSRAIGPQQESTKHHD